MRYRAGLAEEAGAGAERSSRVGSVGSGGGVTWSCAELVGVPGMGEPLAAVETSRARPRQGGAVTGVVLADDLSSGLFGLLMLALLGIALRSLVLWGKRQAGAFRAGRDGERTSVPVAGSGQGVRELERTTRELAGRLLREYEYVDLRRLRDDGRFGEQVGLLADSRFPFEALERLSVDRDNFFVAAIALAAIERRPDVPDAWTTRAIAQLRSCPTNIEPCVYAALARRACYPVVGPSLVNLDEGVSWDELAAFVEARLAGGEELTAETFKRNLPVRLSDRVSEFAARYRVQLGEEFFALAEEWARTTVDTDFITAFARLWDPPFEQPALVEVARRGELAEVVADALGASPSRSVLLVGETGAGKRTLARAALARLGSGVVVFE